MQKATFTGNITNTKLVSGTKDYDEFLSVTVAVNDRNKNSIRIKYTDSNGMLKAVKNGEDLTGVRVTLHGDLDLAGIRSHYVQEEVNGADHDYEIRELRYPELKMNYVYTERHLAPKQEETVKTVRTTKVKKPVAA